MTELLAELTNLLTEISKQDPAIAADIKNDPEIAKKFKEFRENDEIPKVFKVLG